MTIHRGRHSASVSDIDLKIKQTFEEKQQFMPLLLIGDESADMIGRYLERGILYVGYMGDEAVSVCVVTVEDNDTCEVKNLAVKPEWQKNNYWNRRNTFNTSVLSLLRLRLFTSGQRLLHRQLPISHH